jgi:predicted heme/steroid binding protein
LFRFRFRFNGRHLFRFNGTAGGDVVIFNGSAGGNDVTFTPSTWTNGVTFTGSAGGDDGTREFGTVAGSVSEGTRTLDVMFAFTHACVSHIALRSCTRGRDRDASERVQHLPSHLLLDLYKRPVGPERGMKCTEAYSI